MEVLVLLEPFADGLRDFKRFLRLFYLNADSEYIPRNPAEGIVFIGFENFSDAARHIFQQPVTLPRAVKRINHLKAVNVKPDKRKFPVRKFIQQLSCFLEKHLLVIYSRQRVILQYVLFTPADCIYHPKPDNIRMKPLWNKVPYTKRKAALFHLHIIPGGRNDHRDVFVLFVGVKLLHKLKAVHYRHHNIQNHRHNGIPVLL